MAAMHAMSAGSTSSQHGCQPATVSAAGERKPSLAAIKARLAWESKRKEDLLHAQAVSEYYTELYGLPM
eukprot:4888255-Pleurochrysis_carterae.AAC.1